MGEWGEEGPGPPGGGKDKQSMLSAGRDNMGKDEKDQTKMSDVMKEDRRERSERFSEQDKRNYVIRIDELILTLCFSFRRINQMALKNHLH